MAKIRNPIPERRQTLAGGLISSPCPSTCKRLSKASAPTAHVWPGGPSAKNYGCSMPCVSAKSAFATARLIRNQLSCAKNLPLTKRPAAKPAGSELQRSHAQPSFRAHQHLHRRRDPRERRSPNLRPDLGEAPLELMGDREYEYWLTIRIAQKDRLLQFLQESKAKSGRAAAAGSPRSRSSSPSQSSFRSASC